MQEITEIQNKSQQKDSVYHKSEQIFSGLLKRNPLMYLKDMLSLKGNQKQKS